MTTPCRATVLIVDCHADARQLLSKTIQRAGFGTKLYVGADELWRDWPNLDPACLVLGLDGADAGGLKLLEDISTKGIALPTIVVAHNADIRTCARAFKLGVADFLAQPWHEKELIAAVREAVSRQNAAGWTISSSELTDIIAQLSAREKRVFEMLVSGKTLKEIAARTHVTVQSVWKHQQRVFEKLGVRNVVELAHLALSGDAKLDTLSDDAALSN